MATPSPPPELVEVYHLLKTGQRAEAARRLKAYLPQHRRDADAWWLLAHAVPQIEHQRHCLAEVLRLRPDDARARAWLDRLTPADPAPPLPASVRPPLHELGEPDDVMILGLGVRHSTPIPPRPPTGPLPPLSKVAPPAAPRFAPPPSGAPALAPAAPPARHAPPSFEEFAAHLEVDLPAPDDDLFGGPASPLLAAPASRTADPFDSANLFDPALHAHLRPAPRPNQVSDADGQRAGSPAPADESEAAPDAPAEDAPYQDDRQRERANVERMIGRALIAAAAFVLAGIVTYAALSRGWLGAGQSRHVPSMAVLDGGSFTIKYPQGYDARCEHELSGYPVCGIANHAFYNEVDTFAGREVDLAALIAQSLRVTEQLPEEQFSIIVMDVPSSSPAYDDRSWAKTKYEWNQALGDGGWWNDEGAQVDYERQEMAVDGHTAYAYRYTSEGQWRDAAWDVYVPHDGITLWLRVDFFGARAHRLPVETVEAMIDSIDVKPVAEW